MSSLQKVLGVYAVVGLMTFLFQTFIRLEHCAGLGPCAMSVMKGVVWSAMWPAWWLGHLLLF